MRHRRDRLCTGPSETCGRPGHTEPLTGRRLTSLCEENTKQRGGSLLSKAPPSPLVPIVELPYFRRPRLRACRITWRLTAAIDSVSGMSFGQTFTQFCA